MTHKKIIEHELEGFGIRLNKKPPNIIFKKKEKVSDCKERAGLKVGVGGVKWGVRGVVGEVCVVGVARVYVSFSFGHQAVHEDVHFLGLYENECAIFVCLSGWNKLGEIRSGVNPFRQGFSDLNTERGA